MTTYNSKYFIAARYFRAEASVGNVRQFLSTTTSEIGTSRHTKSGISWHTKSSDWIEFKMEVKFVEYEY